VKGVAMGLNGFAFKIAAFGVKLYAFFLFCLDVSI